jgi:hypothetical protein
MPDDICGDREEVALRWDDGIGVTGGEFGALRRF